MGDNLIHAHTIVRDTFARKVRAATDERNRLVDVLTRLRPDQLSASDLELLAADEKGFADLFEAKLAAGEGGMTTALSIAYLHAHARYALEIAESC